MHKSIGNLVLKLFFVSTVGLLITNLTVDGSSGNAYTGRMLSDNQKPSSHYRQIITSHTGR